MEVQLSFGDKLVHAFFYFVLTITSYLYLSKDYKKFKNSVALRISAIGSFIYGMIIEGLQHILPYKRSADWLDVLANGIGTLIAFIAILYILDKNKAQKEMN